MFGNVETSDDAKEIPEVVSDDGPPLFCMLAFISLPECVSIFAQCTAPR